MLVENPVENFEDKFALTTETSFAKKRFGFF